MNPDPAEKLARFTPAQIIDPAELLFAAGRASARTHWGWKVAVAGLLLANSALGGLLLLGSHPGPPTTPLAEPAPVVQPQPEPVPVPASNSAPTIEPWSYRALRATDTELVPNTEPVANLAPPHEPLTVLSGRRGDID